MKLIYISHWRFPSDKTMSPLIMKTCEMFARGGFEVELWIPRRANSQYPHIDPFVHYSIERIFSIKKLPVLDLIELVPGTWSFLFMIFTFALSIWWKSKSLRGEVIWYGHDTRDLFFLRRENVFIEIHDFYESKFGLLNKVVFPRISGFIVTNKIKMARLKMHYHIAESKMIHIPNAVDIARFSRSESKIEARKKLSLPPESKLVIYTGSIFAWKGIHTLALASKYLSENIQIFFAGGNDKERQDFKKFIEENHLSKITLIPLPYEDIEMAPLLMRSADVLVLPNTAKEEVSKYETSPVKLFEYMASGTPIVASDIPSIRNIADESMVFFAKPDDPESFAKVIEGILADPGAAFAKTAKAKEEVRRYTWEERSKHISSFISEIIKRKPAVLVLGNDSRSTLAVVRSLGRAGIKVILGNDEKNPLPSYSRYVSETIDFPSANSRLSFWHKKLKEIVFSRNFDMVIPATESASVPLMMAKEELTNKTLLALPEIGAFNTANSKFKTAKLAEELGIPVPKTWLVEKEADIVNSTFSYPMVAKPVSSKIWVEGYKIEGGAEVVNSEADLRKTARQILHFQPAVLQEYFSGIGAGQEMLCNNGEIIAVLQHERIHEPQGSGGSSFRKTVPVGQRMLECSKKIMKHLNWSGVAMVEYRINPETGNFALLEINGRFWGSLPLALEAGFDFPLWLYEFLKDNKFPENKEYRMIQARNLLNDLKWFWAIRNQPLIIKIPSAGMYFFFALASFVLGRERWDTFAPDDPVPFFAEFFLFSKNIFRKAKESAREQIYKGLFLYPGVRKRYLDSLKSKMKKNARILFVCEGNIARSCFAEQYAGKIFADRGSAVAFSSAGFFHAGGRPANPYAKIISKEFGISLDSHASKSLSDEEIKKSDIIFCMDPKNMQRMKKNFPGAVKKTFLLGLLQDPPRVSIRDPWGSGENKYRPIFASVARSIDSLLYIANDEK